MTVDPALLDAFQEALEPLPGPDGGRVVIAVVDSSPPAMAMLATSSVYTADVAMRFVVDAGSSVATADAGSATLLAASDRGVLLVSIEPLHIETHGAVAVVAGPIVAVHPSVELPWSLQLSFVPSGKGEAGPYLEYWRACRAWLADPSSGAPPRRPQ